MVFSKTHSLFMCCVFMTIFLLLLMFKHTRDVVVKNALREGTPSNSHLHQHQDDSMTPLRIHLGSSIAKALHKLYIASGGPVETTLLIRDHKHISILSVDDGDDDDDDDDYDDYVDDDDYDDDDDDFNVEAEDNYSWEDMIIDDDSRDETKIQEENKTISGIQENGGIAGVIRGDDGVISWPGGEMNSLNGEKTFRYRWNEWDPNGWMSLPMAIGGPDSKDGPAVVFNRVGKCGSRSVLTVFQKLARKNRFYLVSSLTYNRTKLTPSLQKLMVKVTGSLKRPNMFQRHVHFIDYTRYGMPQPLYINIIRDPLERMVSQYYYRRFGDERTKGFYTGDDKYQTFDECVLSKSEECLGPKSFYIIPYFCGQDDKCTTDWPWAFRKALENLEKYYIATGILEEFEDTLRLFEKVLPSMFKGALEIYQAIANGETVGRNSSTMATIHKIKPSPEVTKIMKDHLKLEYTFYNLVKEKFHEQRTKLGLV